MTDRRTIADYRTRVADLYAAVRRGVPSESTWAAWRSERDQLLRTHPESPVADVGDTWPGMPFWGYDPSWRLLGTLEPEKTGADIEIVQQSGLVERFRHAGAVHFDRNGDDFELPIYWAWSYAGGWFLPFTDATSGNGSYGVGRYLLDQAKSADLGSEQGRLILDFNFAYHPSCVWGDWLCPLPRPESRLPVAVCAGEQAAS